MNIFFYLLIIYFMFAILDIPNENNKLRIGYNYGLKCFIALLPLFFLTAFRDISIGNDTYNYVGTYINISQQKSLSEALETSRLEYGFVILNYIASHIGLSYFCLQIIISLFIYFSYYYFIVRYSKNIWLSVYSLFTLRYVFSTMNTVRYQLAIAVLLFAVPYILRENKFVLFLLIFIASSFHSTAYIFILLYFLMKDSLEFKHIFVYFFISLVIAYIGKPFFQILTDVLGKYQGYLDSVYFDVRENVAIYFTLFIHVSFFILLMVYCNKYSKNIPFIKLLICCSILNVCVYLAGLSNSIMSRVDGYFNIFVIISFPESISRLAKDKYSLLSYIIICFLALQFIIVTIYRPGWNQVIPYKFFWETNNLELYEAFIEHFRLFY